LTETNVPVGLKYGDWASVFIDNGSLMMEIGEVEQGVICIDFDFTMTTPFICRFNE